MTRRIPAFFFLICILCVNLQVIRAGDTLSNRKKQVFLFSAASAAYLTGFGSLYTVWYADYRQNRFHFFNDNEEWLQVDKTGHAYTAYQLSRMGHKTLKWSGIENNKAVWIGCAGALLFQSSIEVMDGFSDGWGFSYGDMLANISGSALFAAQELWWKEQRLLLKFSYHYSDYAHYNPDVLGNSPLVRLVKDYNGHTYWVSANIRSWLNADAIPDWVNLAIGYRALGMLSANPKSVQQANGNWVSFPRYREILLSPDIDFTRIPVKSRFLKTCLVALNCIKLPFPALTYSEKNGFGLRALAF